MTPILEFENLTKTYPGVTALDNINFAIERGGAHCLVGENGAGKSTLIKILAGATQPDHGLIKMDGQPVRIQTIHDSQRLGISFIFQEINVVDDLTVADNFTLGREGKWFNLWQRRADADFAREHLERLGVDIDPLTPMSRLSVAQKQMVEIARALSVNALVIVMDEPSAPLTEHELKALFALIERLKGEGVTILYVSHRLAEIFQIGNRYTVLRDGRHVETGSIEAINQEGLISLMVGRDLKNMYLRSQVERGAPVLELDSVSLRDKLRDVTFTLHENEIVGFAGLAGAGRTELANLIFGVTPADVGSIRIRGKAITPGSPRQAIRLGIGLVPEERRAQGIVGEMSVRENISLALTQKISQWGVVNPSKDQAIADIYIDSLNIRTPSPQQRIKLLSGGNQQKCVIARWLSTDSRILLLDEPTRGIDVGAKAEVFALVNQLAGEGSAILLFSSEMEELLGMCDRIMVMNRGRIVAEFSREEATQEKLMHYAASDDVMERARHSE